MVELAGWSVAWQRRSQLFCLGGIFFPSHELGVQSREGAWILLAWIARGTLFPHGLEWLHPLGFALGPPQGWLHTLGWTCQFGSVGIPWELSRLAGGG